MKAIQTTFKYMRAHKLIAVFIALVLAIGINNAIEALTPAKEIALIIGEPWDDMQARSTAKIGDDIPDEIWYRMPDELAYLRFADPKHGFVTPPAKFFTVGFNKGMIDTLRISPQLEPLPLQEALDIVLDLQNQWRSNGWELSDPEEFPAYENNERWKQAIENCRSSSTQWHAEPLYELAIGINCFKRDRFPKKSGYMITISMGKYNP